MNSTLAVERKWTTMLFNPFVYVAGGKALALGFVAILTTAVAGAAGNVHYDGVLDTHVGASAPSWVFAAEGLIDWLSLAVVLWVSGKLISKTTFRAIDLLGTQALARWPALLTTLVVLWLPGFQRFSQYLLNQVLSRASREIFNPVDAGVFTFVVCVMLLMIVWMVALMYKSYTVSCNVRGGKAIGTFILGIVLGEVISKLAVIEIFKLI